MNQDEIYTGLMSTENQVIVIVQNFYAWVTSSIGFLLLIPFYQVTSQIFYSTENISVKEANFLTFSSDTNFQPRTTGREFSVEDYDSAPSQSPWLSPGAVENMSWMLRYLADSIEMYAPDYNNYEQEF